MSYISDLICTRLSDNKSKCSKLSGKIAVSLIRIASTRIFAQPEQSILELVVNSIDSYIEKYKLLGRPLGIETTGKFGLGFFSFLYWLVGHIDRSLTITSSYMDSDKKISTWQVLIRDVNGSMIYKFRELDPAEKTGSSFVLKNDKGELLFEDPNIIDNFKKQLLKLNYITEIKINYPTISGISSIENDPVINIELDQNIIKVSDYALGISKDTLYQSLLVPSISTKQIQPVVITPSVNSLTQIKPSQNRNKFILLVGQIAVVMIDFDPSVKEVTQRYEIILQMTSKTPLPVSRDDILLGYPRVDEEFIYNLTKLRDQALHIGNNALYTLKEAILEYGKSQILVGSLFQKFWLETKKLLEQTNRYFVPIEYYNVYQRLNPNAFISMDEPVTEILEKYLVDKYQWNKKIFYGKYVTFIQNLEPKVTTAGTTRFVFVDTLTSETNINWVYDQAISHPDLLPIGATYGDTNNEDIIKSMSDISKFFHPEIYNLTYQLLLQLKQLNTYFNFNFSNSSIIGSIKFLTKMNTDLSKYMIIITRIFLNKIKSITFTYGHGKPDLWIQDSRNSEYNYKIMYNERGKRDKLISYTKNYYTKLYNLLITHKKYIIIPAPRGLEESINVQDTNIYEYLLIGSFSRSALTYLEPEEKELLINYWRLYLNTPINQDILILYNYNFARYEDQYRTLIRNPLKNLLDISKQNKDIYKNLPSYAFNIRPSQYKYRLSNLIDYVFNHDDLTGDNFLSSMDKISKWEPKTKSPFQAMEIAINEGTTKPFIIAVLTETFQNSLDAMRMNNPNQIFPVNIDIATYQQKSLSVTINDPVGIASDGLMALSIPFLSTKTPSEIITGEMGTGFFNIYRESDFVRIETIKDNKHVLIIDYPIRVNNRVIDVERTMDIDISDRPNSTSITMVYTPNDKFLAFANIYTTAQMSLSLASPVKINDIVYSVDKKLILQTDTFEFYMISEKNTSWILTKGVPFYEFSTYLSMTDLIPYDILEIFTTGVILNIRHGAYTPLQSRTKITISPDKKKQLEEFLYNSMYIVQNIRYSESQGESSNTYIKNSTSEALLRELYLSDQSYKTEYGLLINYRYKDLMSLKQLINDSITYIGNNIPIEREIYIFLEGKLHYEDIQEYDRREVAVLLIKNTWKWLSNKNKQETTAYKRYTEQAVPIEIPENVQKFINIFIETYWTIGQTLTIKGANFNMPTPKIKWDKLIFGTGGTYNKGTNVIYISTISQITINAVSKIHELLSKPKFDILTIMNDISIIPFMGKQFPSSVLIHELTHAWQGTEEIKEIKTPHEPINLLIDGQDKQYQFDEGANIIFDQILLEGFISLLLSNYNKGSMIFYYF